MGGSWTPATPTWVTPPASQIADLHWLAYAMLTQTRHPWAAGVAASIAWIRSGRVGPITERDEQPVTRDLANAERWAAEAARDPLNAPPMGAIYSQLNVAPRPLVRGLDASYAVGCWRALRWVLGTPGEAPPLDVPRRHPDGRVYIADDIYTERTRGDDSHLGPERRAEIRAYADRQAAQYLHTSARIDDIQRRMTTAS